MARFDLTDVARFEKAVAEVTAHIERLKIERASLRESLAAAREHLARGETLHKLLPEDCEVLVTEFGFYATLDAGDHIPEGCKDTTHLSDEEVQKNFEVFRKGNLTIYRRRA